MRRGLICKTTTPTLSGGRPGKANVAYGNVDAAERRASGAEGGIVLDVLETAAQPVAA